MATDGPTEKVLVVDDDSRVRRLLTTNLRSVGYDALSAADGTQAVTVIAREQPDLVVLDLMLPGIDGFEVIQSVRAFSEVPIILLTVKGEQTNKVRGLTLGADDYITKPFGIEELLARVNAVLRRARGIEPDSEIIELPEIRIDTRRREVTVRGHQVRLTPTEYRLLLAVSEQPDRVLSSQELLERVWGPGYQDAQEYLWTYVRYLRRKIERDPQRPTLIRSEPGVGYRLSLGCGGTA
ncbi:MAG: response regulator transcription factor [Acidimicrobiia bacterium]|nr:response regulator transcription factor [Acidimicrobiia bacterium]